MLRDPRLEQYLIEQRVEWTVIPVSDHAALETEWESVYGKVWKLGLRHKRQARASEAYARQSSEVFLIVPFLGAHAGPVGVGTAVRTVAYKCRGDGALPDLTGFQDLDFFVAPRDLSWTMVYTHEDYLWGGPYFIERDLLVLPTRGRRSDGRR